MIIKSKYNPILTLEYMTTEDENKYFDRKSAQKRVSDIGEIITAFANAEGGTVVIGISDKTKRIEGINFVGTDRINDFLNAPKDYCKPMPEYQEEFLDVTNYKGESDQILLLHIKSSQDRIIRTVNDTTYLRIGDRTKEIKGESLKLLEYSKNARKYEDEIHPTATIEDLDADLLAKYKEQIGADTSTSIEQILSSRGFLERKDGKSRLTNGAVLLFAKNIQRFYPNCRVRFVRYDGTTAEVGTRMNIVKDKNIEDCLLKVIDEAKDFVSTQLREFTALNKEGIFQTVPEYPEFAWVEGITNAVIHREYGLTGSYILVAMYDDRLEITSPGELPSIVTIDNIKQTRFSRNPHMARVLTEMGLVRELNEGVKRIYSEMEGLFLEDPIYEDENHQVKLTLKNNIVMRTIRQMNYAEHVVNQEIWDSLDDLEQHILTYMGSHKTVVRSELEKYTGKSERTVLRRLKHLMDIKIIRRNGAKNDPIQTYELILNERK